MHGVDVTFLAQDDVLVATDFVTFLVQVGKVAGMDEVMAEVSSVFAFCIFGETKCSTGAETLIENNLYIAKFFQQYMILID